MLIRPLTLISRLGIRSFSSLKDYTFPQLDEKDLEENFIHGSGPGGQNVNKASNCVHLRHIPTGVFVRVHDSRSVVKNREIARRRLIIQLDDHLNGENSYSAQKRRMEAELNEQRRLEKEKKRQLKANFKMMLIDEENRQSDRDQS